MPSLSIQNSQIEETLRSSLAQGKPEQSLAEILVSQSRTVLLKKIAFVAANVQSCSHLNKVKAKYASLKMTEQVDKKHTVQILNGEHKKNTDGEGLPTPKIVLYPPDSLSLGWKQPVRMGTGLSNLGNTCFCNATLQCLLYTPPLFYYLAQKTHLSECRLHNFCMLCVMEEVVRNVLNKSGGVYQPLPVVRNFKAISKHFTLGRQEDAHEFLRYVIDNMTKSLLFGKPKLDSFSKSTTAVHQIFSGYLRSQVRCKNCDFRSNTYDPFFDIALDIKEAPNIYRALEHFTKGEFLSGENSYLCEKCKRRVNAVKRFSVHKVPNILTLQLKRFDAVRLTKINREVHFPPAINIRPFMSQKQGDPVQFQLYGVLVHQGFSTSSGHYYAFVKSSTGQWLKMDDNRVHKVSQEVVLRQNAYILFYNKTQQVKKSPNPGTVIGPQLPQTYQQNKVQNGPINTSSSTPVMRKPMTPSSTLSKPSNPVTHSNQTSASSITNPSKVAKKVAGSPHQQDQTVVNHSPTNVLPPSKLAGLDQRNKVSFGLNLMKPRVVENKERSTDNGKIVMKIKHGKVVSNTASPPDKPLTNRGATGQLRKSPSDSTQVNGNHKLQSEGTEPTGGIAGVRHRLVPYLDGESSESEAEGVKGKGVGVLVNGSNGVNKHDKENGSGKSNSPPHVNGKEGKKRRHSESFEPVLDEKLKTTTQVPGAYAPLDKEKCNGFKTAHEKTMTRLQTPNTQKSLSVKVTLPEIKVNATSKWTVFEQDQKSPSIASSNSSVGSTSEWKISDGEGKTKKKEDNTTRGGTERDKSVNGNCKKSDSGKNSPGNNKESGQTEKQAESNHVTTAKQAEKTVELPNKTMHLHKKVGHIEPILENGFKEEIMSDSGAKHTKMVHRESSNDTPPETKRSKLEPMETGKPLNEKKLVDKSEVSGKEEQKNYVNCSDKQPLLDSEPKMSAKQHKKKKKKHKQDKLSIYEYSSESEAAVSKRKKKKHKKKKHKVNKADREPLLSDGGKEGKRARVGRQDTGEYNSSTSEEFQWVERTKETIDREHHRHNSVPVHQWDAGVKDLKKVEQNGEKPKRPENKKSWDGTRNQEDILNELYKESLQGYGASVSSWDGGKSTIDQEVIHERRKEKKRNWEEDYEEDLDKGKMKKVKKTNGEKFGSKYNYFQKFQEHNGKGTQDRNIFDTFSSGHGKASYQSDRHHGDTSSVKSHYHGTNGWGSNNSYHTSKDWKNHHRHSDHRH